jgi:hypothetical protein
MGRLRQACPGCRVHRAHSIGTLSAPIFAIVLQEPCVLASVEIAHGYLLALKSCGFGDQRHEP